MHEHDGFVLRVETEPARGTVLVMPLRVIALACYRSCEFDPLTLVWDHARPAKLFFDSMAQSVRCREFAMRDVSHSGRCLEAAQPAKDLSASAWADSMSRFFTSARTGTYSP